MLSRTASDLYWMSRYLERAENLARMLDVSYSLSLLPQDRNGGGLDELAMPLLITGTLDAYLERHGELAAERLLSFFALDPDNPASIYSCLAAARASAHAVRGRITLDMWENINATWLEMRGIAAEGILRYGISRFCEWVKDRSHLFRGATFATSMRNDAFRFIRLGTFIERADNTLRLLDARYQTQGEAVLAGADEGTARGYYQWSALLRALSAFEGYTELYRASPNARNIAELLLLREDVPRSLLSCIEELSEILSGLPGVNGRPAQRPGRRAGGAGALHRHRRGAGAGPAYLDHRLHPAGSPVGQRHSQLLPGGRMRLSITHDTTYRYEDRVRASIQYLRLTPQDSERQHVVDWRLDLPRPARPLRDPYGNILHVLTLDEPHESVLIAAHGLVEIDEEREVEHDRQSPLPFLRSTRLTGADAEMRAFAERAMGGRKDRGGLLDLMHALHEHILYQPGATRVDSTAIEAFGARAGVCQDHAHAFLACIRSQGVPGRYVSGYLYTEDDTHLASHAWAEAWLGDGWYSFDVTNRLGRPERHLKLAVGLDYLDACPVRGLRRGGGCEQMHARVLVSAPLLQVQQQ